MRAVGRLAEILEAKRRREIDLVKALEREDIPDVCPECGQPLDPDRLS